MSADMEVQIREDCPDCENGVVASHAWEEYAADADFKFEIEAMHQAGHHKTASDMEIDWFRARGYLSITRDGFETLPPEEHPCPECDGSGKRTRWIDARELTNKTGPAEDDQDATSERSVMEGVDSRNGQSAGLHVGGARDVLRELRADITAGAYLAAIERIDLALAAEVDIYSIAYCPIHGLHGERTECFVCGGGVLQVQMVRLTDLDCSLEASDGRAA